MLSGETIPFLGAGANLVERPDDVSWKDGKYLPSGRELAEELVSLGLYPDQDDVDLLRISQYIATDAGRRQLYKHLRRLFDDDYPPNVLHKLLAGLPPILRERSVDHQLIITTNYDDALERAFDDAEEEYDAVWYDAKPGASCGKFLHRAPDEETVAIEKPNEYQALDLAQRTVILKLHGAIDRQDPTGDSYVITQNNYVDYLARADVSGRLPSVLAAKMPDCHFLFLGYSMQDWNLRVVLNRVWREQNGMSMNSWAVQKEHERPEQNEVEEKLWEDLGEDVRVFLFQVPLKEYVSNLWPHLFGGVLAGAGT